MAESFLQASSRDQHAKVRLNNEAQKPAGAELQEQTIKRVVHSFYGRVRQDAVLGPVFDHFIGDDWDVHLARMCDFWSAILFQTGRYKGNPMLAHLQIPGISPRHFQRWVELFLETVNEECDAPMGARFTELALRMRENLQRAVTSI